MTNKSLYLLVTAEVEA